MLWETAIRTGLQWIKKMNFFIGAKWALMRTTIVWKPAVQKVMMKSTRQESARDISGKGIKRRDIDKLLSDPKALREACSLIREAITVKARADVLRVRERTLIPDHELAEFLRDALQLKAQADTLAARERRWWEASPGAGIRKRCTKIGRPLRSAVAETC